MIKLMLHDDWEINGDGSGDPEKLMFEPAKRILDICDKHGAKYTFFAEVGQQLQMLNAPDKKWRQYANIWETTLKGAIQRGHDVQLHFHPQWIGAELKNDKWILDYSKWNTAKVEYELLQKWISVGSRYLRNLFKSENIGFIELNHKFQNSNNKVKEIFIYLLATLKLIIISRKLRPDIIVNDGRYTSILAKIVTYFLNIKLYSVAHGSYEGYEFLKEWAWGDKILAVSDTTKQNLIENYKINPKKIKVINNSIKPLKYSSKYQIEKLRDEYNLYSEKIISTSTRFDPIKNVMMTLKALEKIYNNEPDTTLLIIANGNKENEARKYIQRHNISDRTIIINNITDVSTVISVSKFIILTSKREGLPTAVLEAFSLGKPVIATNVVGNNEIVRDEYNGFLVTLNDIEYCSKKIKYLLHMEKKEYCMLSEAAYKTFNKYYNFKAYKNKITKFFEN